MSQIIPFTEAKVPAHLRRADVSALTADLTSNVGGGGFRVMSIKGKSFTVVKGGEREVLMRTNADGDEEVATSINVVLVKANPNISKIWYAKGYTEGSDAKPDCFSNDGIAPDASVTNPQASKCSICPKNQWGSRITENGKKGKACSDNRRVAIANLDEIDDPFLMRIPPASLRPLAEYGQLLGKRGVPYTAVLTKIRFDPEASSPQLMFTPVGFLTEEQFAQVSEAAEGEQVASILGAPGLVRGEADHIADETPEPAPAPAPAPKATKKPAVADDDDVPAPAPAKKAKPAVVDEDDVPAPAPAKKAKPAVAVDEDDAPAPAPAPKAAKKPAAVISDDLENELESMLGAADD